MKHSFLDKYSELDSPVHRIDARIKFIICLVLIIAIVTSSISNWLFFSILSLYLIILLAVSRLPLLYIIKRALMILPFILVIAIFIPFFTSGETVFSFKIWIWTISITSEGLWAFKNVITKSFLSILCLILLTSTTKFSDLLNGLYRIGFPSLMISILSFMYRYIFILIDEIMRMSQARDSRSFGNKGFSQMKTAGNIIGTLFIRSYERGERVYSAMLARGFDGEVRVINNMKITMIDIWFCILSLLVLSIAIITPFLLNIWMK